MANKRFFTSRNVAFLAVLVALVVVLQVMSTLIGRLGGTPLSLVLIPVVLGAVMIGPLAGTLLHIAFASPFLRRRRHRLLQDACAPW